MHCTWQVVTIFYEEALETEGKIDKCVETNLHRAGIKKEKGGSAWDFHNEEKDSTMKE